MPTATDLSLWDDFEVPAQARRGQITLSLHDHLATYVPKRPAAYLRISSDRFGLEAGVDRQQEDTNDTRKRLRWPEFVKVYKENDTSAFKKRKVVKEDGTIDWVVLRPKFRQLLADLASGEIDGVIFYDLDRLVRRPRDLEDLIDIVEYVKRPVLGATGGHMNLINDSDRHMARIMCVMALKSSEDTSRRVARMHLSCAQDGKIQGRIAYGWVRTGAEKGTLKPEEAKLVEQIFNDCLTGETAYGIATKLNRQGIASPAGTRWSSTMVNKLLRNPRYCGMVSYGGQHRIDPTVDWDGWSRVLFDDTGRPLLGTWETIITPKDWSQVQFELQLRRQKRGLAPGQKRPPVAAKYLLSGIFRCGKCGRGMVGAWPGGKANPARREYRCPPSASGGCNGTSIVADAAERAVVQGMETFLLTLFEATSPDQEGDPTRLAALRAKLEEEIQRKRKLITRWTEGSLSEVGLEEDDYLLMLAGVNSRIGGMRAEITTAEGGGPRTIPRDKLLQGWRDGTVQQRRTLLKRYLHHITVLAPVRDLPDGVSAVQARLNPQWKTKEEIAA
ncbi:recombinase family protein [Streptomyces sp. NPDC002588]|uniref:recombinase family protein n=1 Tax=Streptomyces sp. NPDC002588 TaxID=3154419 RepID=UPI003330B824